MGKQTELFKNPIAAGFKDAKCISLIDRKQTLNLVSDTTEQLSSLLFGLQSLENKKREEEEECRRTRAQVELSSKLIFLCVCVLFLCSVY